MDREPNAGGPLAHSLSRSSERTATPHTHSQMANSGNVAFPYAPMETALGEFCEFNIYHIIPTDDGLALFPIHYEQVSYPPKVAKAANGQANGHLEAANGAANGNAATANGAVDPYVTVSREISAWVSAAPPEPTFGELVKAGRTSASIAELARICRSKNVSAV